LQLARTATTANAILGLLALRPEWPIYELTQQLRRNLRFFWPRAESRIYDEAKALVARGLARARTTTVGGRTRTTYAITSAGRDVVEGWLATEPRGTALECEPLLRVLLAEAGKPEQLSASLTRLRRDAEEILAAGRIVAPEYFAGTAPFQDQVHVRALIFDFLSHHALMLLEWAERTEKTLARWPGLTEEARRREAIASIRRDFARFPPPP
jgi:DNA-binding PadR family transcriptional regulator